MPKLHAKTILIVDEDQAARARMGRLLTDAGFDVQIAKDPEVGLDVAARVGPCLIILDMDMPRLGGWQLARRLKSAAGPDAAPLLGLSFDHSPVDQAAARHAGCDGHLMKPLDTNAFLATVTRLSGAIGPNLRLVGAAAA